MRAAQGLPAQAAARYCAMLGRMAIDNHDRVGLVLRGDSGPRYVVPQAGGGHVLRVVRECVESPVVHAGGLADLIATVNARVRRRAVVFVLSDFLTPGYEHALQLSSRHHDVVAMRFLGREFFDPPRRLLRARACRVSKKKCLKRGIDLCVRTRPPAHVRERETLRERSPRTRLPSVPADPWRPR